MSAIWTVIAGNVGKVYAGSEQEARYEYADWCTLSAGRIGRAAGEPVTLLKDNVPVLEYAPEDTSHREHCTACGNQLAEAQIGMCDSCQDLEARPNDKD